MSQIGTIISCGGQPGELGNTNWIVNFTYQLDSGATGQAQAAVGNAPNPSFFTGPTAALWASPTSTVTLSPNPPGTTSPVLLPCPPSVQAAAFGLPLK
jgi:hypothetical protein